MARKVRDARLDTRSARLKLKARREPYWRSIAEGFAVGYRQGARSGTWIARAYLPGDVKQRRYEALGAADDALDADGAAILTFDQAQAKGRAWFAKVARMAAGQEPETGPYTVRDAMRDYLAWYAKRRKAHQATSQMAIAHILPALGDKDLSRLTLATVRTWHENLAAAPARLRTAPGHQQNIRKSSSDPDMVRRRRASANRILTLLRAALNHAWREGKAASDEAWRRVKPFRDVDSPVIRYLTAAESARLVNATAPAFRPLVRAALLTGCRYGELIALRVADFNPEAGTLVIRAPKSGKARHVILTEEGQAFFAEATAGKVAGDPIFVRPGGEPWGKSHQQRPLFEACQRAKISPTVSFHVLRHTHGSLLAMAGVPLPVIARQLGHADTRMTERHYAHLAPSYVADTIRRNFPILGIVPEANVTSLPTGQSPRTTHPR